MKKNIIIKVVASSLLVAGVQLPAAAQTVVKETGLNTFMQIELIGLLVLIGLIFSALMFDFPKVSTAGISASNDITIIAKPAGVRQYIANNKFEKMLKAGTYGAVGLLILYLIIIILMLI